MDNEKRGSNTNNTLSEDIEINYHYTSKNKIYYGVHPIHVIREGKRIEVTAKFDTGARSSSIDLGIAEKLGLDQDLIKACEDLDKIEISRNITKKDIADLESRLTDEYGKKYDVISSVRISKSSSGFSLRPYIRITLEFNGRYVTTEVNLRDRSGLSCEMLVGLGDML